MRSSVLACYGNFYAGVRYSAAIDVRNLAWVFADVDDVRSTTGSNLRYLTTESGVDPRENVSGMGSELCLKLNALFHPWTPRGYNA